MSRLQSTVSRRRAARAHLREERALARALASAPTVESAQSGDYKPLSRPLYIYAKKQSFAQPEIKAFIQFILDNEKDIAAAAQFVPLTDEQLQQAKETFQQAAA